MKIYRLSSTKYIENPDTSIDDILIVNFEDYWGYYWDNNYKISFDGPWFIAFAYVVNAKDKGMAIDTLVDYLEAEKPAYLVSIDKQNDPEYSKGYIVGGVNDRMLVIPDKYIKIEDYYSEHDPEKKSKFEEEFGIYDSSEIEKHFGN